MTATTPRLRVGLVPVMAGLYRQLVPDLASKIDAFVREIRAALGDDQVELVSGNVVAVDAEIRAAVKDLERAGVDLLVLDHASYCPSGQILPALLETSLPILLWPGQPLRELVASTYDFEAVLLNHGVHGTQDLANMLRRRRRPFGLLHGHVRQEGFKRALRAWALAGRVVTAMKLSRPLMLGGHFQDMLDLHLEEEPFLRTFGVHEQALTREEFLHAVQAVSGHAVEEKVGQYVRLFDRADGVTAGLLEKSARHELAVRGLLARYESRAVGINFLALCNDPDIADALHVAASVLMSEGVGYGGEGDWATAMLVRGLLAATPRASFSEVFSVGYADNRLVLRHWGEGNFTLARAKPVLRASTFTGDRVAEFAVLDFEFQPGPVTLVNLNATPEGAGQLIAIAGQIEPEGLPAVDGPRGIFRPACGDVRDLLTAYARSGGSHHLALLAGDGRDLVGNVAELCDWKYRAL